VRKTAYIKIDFFINVNWCGAVFWDSDSRFVSEVSIDIHRVRVRVSDNSRLAGSKKLNENRIVFITGATGLVGGSLAMKAVEEGYRVRLLVREKAGGPAGERIRKLFSLLGMPDERWDRLQENVALFPGDVTLPRFGLPEHEWGRLAQGLSAIFHGAACTGFGTGVEGRSASVNIDGTRNVLKLTETSGAHMFQISTAYVVGRTLGKVFEEALTGTFPWKNIYEKTKFIAEGEVHLFCRERGLDYTVFRPAVLTGDSKHGRTIRFNNLYNFMKIANALSRRRKGAHLIVEANPGASLNILPVDFAVDTMWRIFRSSGTSGKIFHITNPAPPALQDLASVYGRILELNIRCVSPSSPPNSGITPGGKRIGSAFAEYTGYMFGEPEFDLSQTRSLLEDYDEAFPRMDEGYYRKILDFAVRQRWREPEHAISKSGAEKILHRYSYLYFEEFLKEKLDKLLIPNLKNLNAVVAIDIRDEPESDRVIVLEKGKLTAISRNGLTPECTYETDAATFEAIARGVFPPQQAFFEGKGDIRGDIEKGLRVITALSEFFRLYPFVPDENRG
jgi:nucleoside-diphosphate-sugar epimerase